MLIVNLTKMKNHNHDITMNIASVHYNGDQIHF